MQSDMPAQWSAALEELADLMARQAQWRASKDQAATREAYHLAKERFDPALQDRIQEKHGQLAHMAVLLEADGALPNPPRCRNGCRPPFELTCEELLSSLTNWIRDEALGLAPASEIPVGRRMQLAWSGLILASHSLQTTTPAYGEEFIDAARSIYAFASNHLADPQPLFTGRHQVDQHLMLSFAAFPFLEGLLRRELAEYVTRDGRVIKFFPVTVKRPGDRLKPGDRLNSIGGALELLEYESRNQPLGSRLSYVKMLPHTGLTGFFDDNVQPASGDLFEAIQYHRNLNLHGGGRTIIAGRIALILATIIALHSTGQVFDELRKRARMGLLHVPADPNENWPHWLLFPPALTKLRDFRKLYCCGNCEVPEP